VDGDMTSEETIAQEALRVEGEMTIYRALELKDQLFPQAAVSPATALDLSAVTEIDTAGVQLLLLAQRAARAAGHELRIMAPSAAVLEVLNLMGLDQLCATAGAA
jgi:anti-sigma B factor antagonist